MPDLLFALLTTFATGIVVPIPEEAVVLGLGATLEQPLAGVSAAFLGFALRDVALFGLGRAVGKRALGWPLLGPALARALAARPASRGSVVRTVLAARFAFGLKTGAQLALGVLHLPVGPYLAVNLLVLAFWVPLWYGLGMWFEQPARHFLAWSAENKLLLFAMFGIALLAWAARKLDPGADGAIPEEAPDQV